jgi:hypothetical protein
MAEHETKDMKGGDEKGGEMKDHHHNQHYKLWVDDAWAKEGHTMKFEVHLNKEADHDITVYYKTYNGTAKDGKDYHGEYDSVVIHAGDDSATIYIDTKDDHRKEHKEYFYVKIDEHDPYVKVKDHYGKGWIHDNDGHKHHEHYEHNADVWMG